MPESAPMPVEPPMAAPPADFAETMRKALAEADADVPAKPAAEPEAMAEAAPRRSIAAALGWLLFALTTTAIGVGVFAQGEIMARFPQTRPVYQTLRFPVPPPGDGLAVETAAPARTEADGKPMLEIAGKIRNPGGLSRPIPTLRAVLRDGEGKDVAAWDFKAEAPRVEPGSEVAFRTTLADPPAGASQLQILFLEMY
jgi:hypothetical protein